MKLEKITNVITDYVANGSFKSLNDNVNYLNDKNNAYARLIRLTDFKNNYSENDAIYVSEHSFNYLKKSSLEHGDLIISNVGANLGTVFKCPKLSIKMTLGPNAILIRANPIYTSNSYLYYLFLSKYGQDKLLSLTSGSAMPKFTKTDLRNLEITIHDLKDQQHIVNTIGSVDDLIEKYQNIESKIINIGLTKINNLICNGELQNLNNFVKFEKGYEVGSSNYVENPKSKNNLIQYIRVGDLDTSKDCFIPITDKIKTCETTDILIAFDGAPGRLNIGLNGAYSSGIYKVNGDNKGLIFYSLLSEFNQKIIRDNSQGTTILHASKAIPFLKYPQISSETINWFNSLFYLLIKIKNKKKVVQQIKQLLLKKYFTN